MHGIVNGPGVHRNPFYNEQNGVKHEQNGVKHEEIGVKRQVAQYCTQKGHLPLFSRVLTFSRVLKAG
jgi:hypothetical protein